ncbi:MAG: hypothetical protein REH79_02415 [Spiroplasma sp.]|nr:hypothetical protein [Spiroplasma sp.]
MLFLVPMLTSNYQKYSIHNIVKIKQENVLKNDQEISELRKRVEITINAINSLLDMNVYAGVMHLFEDALTKVANYDYIENPSNDLQWLRNQLGEIRARFNISPGNGDLDETLQKYFNKKITLDNLFSDLKVAKAGLENANKENQKKFSSKDFLKKIVRRYDLLLREFRELNIETVINSHVFSWEVYSKYKIIENFIAGDNKTIFHQYIKEFLDKVTENFAELIDELDIFDHSNVDSEKKSEKLHALHKRLIEYRDDISYLITEDFKEEFPDVFMQLESFKLQAEVYIKDLDNKIIKSFTDHFNTWNKTFQTQKTKITEAGVWETVESLYKIFSEAKNHYHDFKKDNEHIKLNYSNCDFAFKTVINTINTIEYKGVDKIVIEDPENNPNYVTYYMSDESYASFKAKQNVARKIAISIVAVVNLGITNKLLYPKIARYVSQNGRILSWTSYKYFPNWAPKWLGRVSGFVGSAVVSGLMTFAIDAVFGSIVDDILNKKWISEDAGVSFKINTKAMWIGAYFADAFHKTAKAQEMKYLHKIDE